MAKLRITQVKSVVGSREGQRKTLESLGLHRMNDTVVREDSPSVRGMIIKVRHLLKVEAELGNAK